MYHSAVLLQPKFFCSMTSNTLMKGQNNRYRIKDAATHQDELQRLLKDSDWGFNISVDWSLLDNWKHVGSL